MVYFRAFSSLNTLPEELRPYVPLFCSVLTKYDRNTPLCVLLTSALCAYLCCSNASVGITFSESQLTMLVCKYGVQYIGLEFFMKVIFSYYITLKYL